MNQTEKIYSYCEKYSKTHSSLLHQLERETHLKTTTPRMLSGRIQGRILSFVSHLIRPDYVLEIGTFTGYSALCLAEGLSDEGKVLTLEVNEEMEPLASRFFKASEYAGKIDMRIANAIDMIPTLDDGIDLVFIDAKKMDYKIYYDLVFDKVRSGGVIIADNVIWAEKILDSTDKKTSALHEFNEKLLADDRVENFILPVRDGLNIVRKK